MRTQDEKQPAPSEALSDDRMKDGRLGAEQTVLEQEIEETTPNYAYDDENNPDQEEKQ